MNILQKGLRDSPRCRLTAMGQLGRNWLMHYIPLLTLSLILVAVMAVSEAAAETFWQTKDMLHCGGDLHDSIKYDGTKSTVQVPGDGESHRIFHCIQFCDYTTDTFVLEFGEVSPWIEWELRAVVLSESENRPVLMSGKGGGTYREPMSKLGISNLEAVDMTLTIRSAKPGVMEVKRWAVESPKVRFTKEHAAASKALVGADPLQRGHIPHWNPKIGGFVCACNTTHAEHYNYWLEDEGEQLFSFGNYPKMMKLYGKPMRDFIVEHCRHGAPVRRINDQPLKANTYLTDGDYRIDTGLIVASGNLAAEPFLDVRHSTYEVHGLLFSLGGFYVAYKAPDGTVKKVTFDRPSAYKVEYHKPKKDNARMTITATDSVASAAFNIDVFHGRVTVSANVSNKSKEKLGDVEAGFEVRKCENYFKSPLNRVRKFSDAALLYSEQPMLQDCNVVRLAGAAANKVEVEMNGDNIKKAQASAAVSDQLAPRAKASLLLADINAGATSFVDRIDNYKDVDFADADISMSYVPTYALLGLATYCYRFPEDTEARQVADEMIKNFLRTRERLGNRDLGYFIWTLDLLGRTKDANDTADLLLKRIAKKKSFGGLDASGMAIGLRRIGRWDAADKLMSKLDKIWDFGVVPATDFLGAGALQSPAVAELAYEQLSNNISTMYWDQPDKITTHTNRFVEEGPAETQAYTLVGLDIIYRLYGGIAPIRLNVFAKTKITRIAFDEKSGEWKVAMANADEVDVFTHFRAPKRILWNGAELAKGNWKYSKESGVIYVTGLSGDGELSVTVKGTAPKDDPAWEPIDYLGIGGERK